jgi:hypothetical protein
MKVLSVSQPWAALVVLGARRFETRAWHTAHRGTLAIHATRRFPPAARIVCRQEPIRSLLVRAGFDDWRRLPLGAVIGTVDLAGCTRVEELPPPDDLERALGDFSPGRWAWQLREPFRWAQPLPAVGRLGVFELNIVSLTRDGERAAAVA